MCGCYSGSRCCRRRSWCSIFATRWPGTIWPTQFGLANYAYVLGNLSEAILNSVVLSLSATALCVLGGTLAAYAANRGGPRTLRALDLTVMLPFVMPGLITGIAFLLAFNSADWC